MYSAAAVPGTPEDAAGLGAAWGVFDTVTGLGAETTGLDAEAAGLATVSAFFLMPIFSRILEKRPILAPFGCEKFVKLIKPAK